MRALVSSRRRDANPRVTATLLALLATIACSGGGSSPTDPGMPSGRSFTFLPDGAPVQSSVSLRGAPGFRASQVTLDLVATDVDDLARLSFAFDYPQDLVELHSVVVEGFAPNPGVEIELPDLPGGGTDLLSFDAAAPFDGDGILVRFVFDYRTASGSGARSGAVTFTEGAAFDSLLQPLPMTFIGGVLTVD